MLAEIVWLMTKAYIILIFTAAVIRSEQILYGRFCMMPLHIFSEVIRKMECMAASR